jgi:hypothetical protein
MSPKNLRKSAQSVDILVGTLSSHAIAITERVEDRTYPQITQIFTDWDRDLA